MSVPGDDEREVLADNPCRLAEQYIILMDLPKEGTNAIIPNSFVDVGGKRRRRRVVSAHVQQYCFALNSQRAIDYTSRFRLEELRESRHSCLFLSRFRGSAGMVEKRSHPIVKTTKKPTPTSKI